jgi:hypothetical protein
MAAPITVNDLISEVRSGIDEQNVEDISDAKILAALNHAQRVGANKLLKNYDELFLTERDVVTTEATQYAMHESIYGSRLERVELIRDGLPYELVRVSYRNAHRYQSRARSAHPTQYTIVERAYRPLPAPTAGLTLREWFIRTPETLVASQGRITTINTAENYVLLDAVGSALTTDATNLYNYINFVDKRTGRVKGSAQINAVDSAAKKITIKTASLSRADVLGKTIAVALPADLAPDDYICVVHGTCVPEFMDAHVDYLVQRAIVRIKRHLGEPTNEEYSDMKDQEQDLKNTWVGRESTLQVKRRNRNFTR